LLDRVLAAIRGEPGTGLGEGIARQEAQSRIATFREFVQAEARRRTAELRGRDRIAKHAVAPQTDLVSFSNANREQLAELRRTIQPLSRKLATRLAARRRRARRGQIDLRRTLRRSLATGGVPMRPALRARRPGRPELVLLCDVSGSVAGFAQFTLLLVQALADQFSKVRSFAFVELTDEITRLVAAGSDDPEGLARRILTEARLTRWGMSSDYGDSLASFVEGFSDAIGPRTSVLILGDARTNGGDPNLAAVREIADRARHVYWLNPEPRSTWGTGDSAALEYGRVVPMHECRNLRQLARLVTDLLPT
ncbi:VWA domain-containing protein, partial [Amycolatopsis rhizosphaerae]